MNPKYSDINECKPSRKEGANCGLLDYQLCHSERRLTRAVGVSRREESLPAKITAAARPVLRFTG